MEFADNPENKESSGNKRNYQTENLNEYEFNEGENFHTYHCTKSSVAKQNQKFPFHFFSGPPPPPPPPPQKKKKKKFCFFFRPPPPPPPGGEKKKGKKNFLFFPPGPGGGGRGAPIRFTT